MAIAKKFLHRNALCISIFAKNTEPTVRLRNFVCGHCDRNLSFPFNLLRHIQNIQISTENFNCLPCSVLFGCAELQETHEKQIRLQASPSAVFQSAVSDHNLQASCVQTSINDTFKFFRLNLEPENVEPFFLISNIH